MSRLSPQFAVLFVLLAGTAAPVVAKDKEATVRPAQIQQLYGCRDMADPTARLACFDREVGELAAADAASEIRFADKETSREARRGLFGFAIPNLDRLFGSDEEKTDEQLQTTLKAVSTTELGRYRLTLADGAVWVQIEDMGLIRPPRAGQTIEIKKGAIGSYFGKVDGGRAIRIRRER